MAVYQFVNPYNFIPLGKEKSVGEKADGTYTGMIQYSLLTKTPLFIPNTSNNRAFKAKKGEGNPEHKSYDFFSYTNLNDTSKTYEKQYQMPIIPGSEIRGVLRSNYEILTNSCMSAIDDHVILSKRTNEVYKPGLLKKNRDSTYSLYDAEDCIWRTKGEDSTQDELRWKDEYGDRKCYKQKDFLEGSRVSFHYERRDRGKPLAKQVSLAKRARMDTGYIIKGEDGPDMGEKKKAQKHCCHVFKLTSKCVSRSMPLDTLDAVLTEYKNNGEHPYTEYHQQLEHFKTDLQQEYFPVYYSKIDDYIMLSPASITREIYNNRLRNLIGTFASCGDKNSLCPACSLFGTLNDSFAKTSRIRFSDLICEEKRSAESCYDPIVTLRPLSSPKLNNMEFYLKQPELKQTESEVWFWSYDYYVDSEGNIHSCTPSINGRKFYWHQMDVMLPKNVEETKLNMTIRPVKNEVTFTGKLYFENLTQKELNQLIWLLNAGEDSKIPLENRTHGYKLGAAKPLGLGSVAIAVEKVLLRQVTVDAEKHTIIRSEVPYIFNPEKVEFAEEVKSNFIKMIDFHAVKGERVCYPTLQKEGDSQEGEEGFAWFVKNHKGYNHKKSRPTDIPNTRKDMYYEKHMEAMNPGLVFTSSCFKPKRDFVTAVITGIDSCGNVYIDVNGKKGSIRINNKNRMRLERLSKGDHIKVKFLKKVFLKNGGTADNYAIVD